MNYQPKFSDLTAAFLRDVLGVAVEESPKGFRARDSFINAALTAHTFGKSFTPLRNKRPYVIDWPSRMSSDIQDLLRWRHASVMRGSACDFGIGTGNEHGLVVLDFDGKRARINREKLEAEYGKVGPTWEAKTPSGGIHVYCRPIPNSEELRTTSKVLGCELDIRGWHGQSVCVGATSKNGGDYEWAPNCAPDEVELAELPRAWYEVLPKRVLATAIKPAQLERRVASRRPEHFKTQAVAGSMVLGDGPKGGGFHGPINRLAIRYFLTRGEDAPAETLIGWLRKCIEAAPKAPGRDVSRYLSDEYLRDAVEGARSFVGLSNER
jgi:hypothetical protein